METNEKTFTEDQFSAIAKNISKISDNNLSLQALFSSIDAIIEIHEESTGEALGDIHCLINLSKQVSTELNEFALGIDQILTDTMFKK